MTKNGEEYFRTLLNAQRRGLQKLTKQQQIKIEKIYEQVFQDAYRDFINGKKNLTNKKYQNQMKAAYIQQLYKELKSLSNNYNIKISKLTEDFHNDFITYVIPDTEKTIVYTSYMEMTYQTNPPGHTNRYPSYPHGRCSAQSHSQTRPVLRPAADGWLLFSTRQSAG